jgi:hypothetical protein
MRRVKIPQRLHRDVERPRCESVILLSLGQHPHQIEWRVIERAHTVKAAQRGMLIIQAQHAFEPSHLRKRARNQHIGGGGVGVMDLQGSVGAERVACPNPQQGRRNCARSDRQ